MESWNKGTPYNGQLGLQTVFSWTGTMMIIFKFRYIHNSPSDPEKKIL